MLCSLYDSEEEQGRVSMGCRVCRLVIKQPCNDNIAAGSSRLICEAWHSKVSGRILKPAFHS